MISTLPNHDSIATAAYFLWEDEGRPHGRHEDHWFAAEAGLTRAPAPEAAEAAPAPKAAPVRKPAAAKKTAPARAAKPPAPKAPAEAVVAAAALAAPRAARTPSKGARNAH